MPALAHRDIADHDAVAGAARGARVLADGRWVVDFDNLGGAVILGHADPQVEEAAAAAAGLRPADLRLSLAERLGAMVPCAEECAFFPTQDSALAQAQVLARKHTGHDRIIFCTPGAEGADAIVPGDAAGLAGSAGAGDVAAIVVAPVGLRPACPSFLAHAREVAHRCGAVLIFDETNTAFRVHHGGAQALLGVVPDLAVLGEALGNGRPIAALAGRSGLVDDDETQQPVGPEVLGAAIAVVDRLAEEPVIAHLAIRGSELQAELAERIRAYGAEDLVAVAGDPTMASLVFADAGGDPDHSLRAVWSRECAERGVWRLDEHFISYAHGDAEIARLLEAS